MRLVAKFATEPREVLTLHRDYFRLRKPLERRIYELARKHCGRQKQWKISLHNLQEKCGSNSTLREFRRLIRAVVEQDEAHNHIPDYAVRFEADEDMVVFNNRNSMPSATLSDSIVIPPLDGGTYEIARTLAPGWDVRLIEDEWRAWATETPRNPEQAFLGFCKKWYEKRGKP